MMKPKSLDEATQLLVAYGRGEGGFDELDFKEYLTEVWLAEKLTDEWNLVSETVHAAHLAGESYFNERKRERIAELTIIAEK